VYTCVGSIAVFCTANKEKVTELEFAGIVTDAGAESAELELVIETITG
jgi:hypothetical protein